MKKSISIKEPKIGDVVKFRKEAHEWCIQNLSAYECPRTGEISDLDMITILMRSLYANDIISEVIGFGSNDEETSQRYGTKLQYLRVVHFIDGVPFDMNYQSVIDIEKYIKKVD